MQWTKKLKEENSKREKNYQKTINNLTVNNYKIDIIEEEIKESMK